MIKEIKLGKKIFIRNAGKDEYWLQDIIYENPEKLGLGNLESIRKEKKQSHGGRLDILLKDPVDNSMYEVEIMLGATDPSHIIRSLIYWDNEKRKYPQRQHFSVLVAESFERQYFNVIQLLSLNVPMIAIQVDLLEIEDQNVLNFTKILDIYEEPEEEEDVKVVTEKTWKENAEWVLRIAQKHLQLLSKIEKDLSLKFTQSYISLSVNKKFQYYFNRRAKPNSKISIKIDEPEKTEKIKNLFNNEGVDYDFRHNKIFILTINENFLDEKANVFLEVQKIKSEELKEE